MSAAAPPRVLLAVADETTGAVLTHRLARDGVAVVPAADGADALFHACAGACDLALLDARLPGVDGLGVLRALRSAEAGAEAGGARTPVVLLAWPGNDRHVADALDAGADDVLVRPFSLVEAAARIRRLLPRR